MNQKFFRNEHVNVRVCEWGNKENPTIICLHGLGSTNLSFLQIAEMLENDYYILSIDLPGHGQTPVFAQESDYSIPNLTNWLARVLEVLDQDKFYLLAHSWGGDIALHYNAKHSERVIKTVLLDGGYYLKDEIYRSEGFVFNSLEDEIKYYENDFDGYIFDSWNDWLTEEKKYYSNWSYKKEISTRDLMKEEEDKVKFRASGDTARAAIKSMYNYPTSNIYNKLSDSILLLQCTLPEKLSKTRDELVQKFSKETGCIVKKINDTSHMLHWDRPEEVTKEIMMWFNK